MRLYVYDSVINGLILHFRPNLENIDSELSGFDVSVIYAIVYILLII